MSGKLANFNKLCRLCAKKINILKGINIFKGDGGARQINNKINNCLPIQVLESDDFPKMICSACNRKLELYFVFREKSLQAQSLFMSLKAKQNLTNKPNDLNIIIKNSLPVPVNTFVKSEIISDTIYPDITDHESYTIQSPQYEMDSSEETEFAVQNVETVNSKRGLMNGLFQEVLKQETDAEVLLINIEEEIEIDEKIIVQSPYMQHISRNSIKPNNDVKINEELINAPVKNLKNDASNNDFGYKDTKILESLLKTGKPPNNQTHCKAKTSNIRNTSPTSPEKESETLTENSDDVPVEEYVCQDCGKTLTSSYELTQHKRTHKKKLFKCITCQKEFWTKSELKAHNLKHIGSGRYVCQICKKGFHNVVDLTEHRRNEHNDVELKTQQKCTTCEKSFASKHSLNLHMLQHLGVPFMCDICGQGFTTKASREEHLNVHNKFPCKTCKKSFVKKKYLNIHSESHAEDKYICEQCGKAFVTRGSLNCHTMLHTGEKPYMCEVCGKTFAKTETFVCHRRLHTGERPFRCNICEKSFAQSSTLTVHKRRHTGEKPYKCKVCSKSFISSASLMLHMRRIHKLR